MTYRSTGLLAVLLLAVSACSAPAPSKAEPYKFDQRQAAVKVDTPELRKQKGAAAIDPCPLSDSTATPVDGGLPDLTLPCLGGGRSVHLAGLRGTPTVINLWAQYCGPCRKEAPHFQQLHEAAGGDLAVIGIDWQDTRPGAAIAFADELGLTYPMLADPEAATRAPLRVSALPMTLLVDDRGVVVHTQFAVVTSAAELADLVERKLDVRVDVGAR
ncbi:MAG: TlpA disulfide reductase family protein [Nocardioidaceae bacterium]